MSHANPSRDLGIVIERAVDLLLVDLEGKRLARTKRTRRETRVLNEGTESVGAPSERSQKLGRVTNATRREVFERDGLRCTYVAEDGHHCEATAFLELDHVEPKARGGSNDVRNLRVRCRAHNQFWAEQAFGRERVEQSRHFRQKKLMPERGEQKHRSREAPTAATIFEKVRLALRGLGFRDHQARRAVAEVARKHDANEPLAVEQTLREALLVATAA
jgi:hypothetical protein